MIHDDLLEVLPVFHLSVLVLPLLWVILGSIGVLLMVVFVVVCAVLGCPCFVFVVGCLIRRLLLVICSCRYVYMCKNSPFSVCVLVTASHERLDQGYIKAGL